MAWSGEAQHETKDLDKLYYLPLMLRTSAANNQGLEEALESKRRRAEGQEEQRQFHKAISEALQMRIWKLEELEPRMLNAWQKEQRQEQGSLAATSNKRRRFVSPRRILQRSR